ncbi:MAG: glyoxalase/bleomycin resistance/dioxygenase family protein [Sulfurimonas sp.]|nr:glyoxalase/bleomycin resistance/dioxygenase family protein [Sulfurimonas sp.]
MNKLHMHISVKDLEKSRLFYTALFGHEPTKVKDDYLQWVLENPSVNFALSLSDSKEGLNHIGIQYDSDEAVEAAEKRLKDVNILGEKQEEALCCYAKSNKYWVEDPSKLVWENYHTMEEAEMFGGDSFTGGQNCCEPTFSKNGKWSAGSC